ncbi:hypothetical protein QFC24_003162 [Naganishia onofrii]|uniref:Uncharacterized protein n=1 Tax=Naganishia onofrii TaxID=1851511 RepID=A0ACC2XLD1_9TREE|nr:hypothetical protein QFC24_003162 [Naganishia onofrii]
MTPSIDKLVMNDIQQSLDELKLDMKSTIQEEEELKLSAKSTKKKNKKVKARQNLGKNNKPKITFLDLPCKLIERIASMVRHESLKSLANLNICSEILYELTSPVLWKEVYWTEKIWKGLRVEGDVPLGWQFVEYIHFSGKEPWFWQGFVDILSPELRALGCQDTTWALWPELRAVVRTELCEGVEVPKAVWLTVKGASHKQQATEEESPISKVIGMAYKAWNLSCGILPKFVAHYQAGTGSNTEAWQHVSIPPNERSIFTFSMIQGITINSVAPDE